MTWGLRKMKSFIEDLLAVVFIMGVIYFAYMIEYRVDTW